MFTTLNVNLFAPLIRRGKKKDIARAQKVIERMREATGRSTTTTTTTMTTTTTHVSGQDGETAVSEVTTASLTAVCAAQLLRGFSGVVRLPDRGRHHPDRVNVHLSLRLTWS